MEKYNYYMAVEEDVINFINEMGNEKLAEFNDLDELGEYLCDELWACDRVTGNGSGSYTLSGYTAEEYLCHNWDLLNDAIVEYSTTLPATPEEADVLIRCYVLPTAIEEACTNDEVANLFYATKEEDAIASLIEDGWQGTDVSLRESLKEYGFAAKMEGGNIETLYRVNDNDELGKYYHGTLTVKQYRDIYGVDIDEGEDDAQAIAFAIEDASCNNDELREFLTGGSDAWAALHTTTLAEFAL